VTRNFVMTSAPEDIVKEERGNLNVILKKNGRLSVTGRIPTKHNLLRRLKEEEEEEEMNMYEGNLD
jgi:hypothetical protein